MSATGRITTNVSGSHPCRKRKGGQLVGTGAFAHPVQNFRREGPIAHSFAQDSTLRCVGSRQRWNVSRPQSNLRGSEC